MIKKWSEHGLSSLFTTKSTEISPGRVLRGGPKDDGRDTGFTQLSTSLSSAEDQLNTPGTSKSNYIKGLARCCTPKAKLKKDAQDVEMGVVKVRKDVSVIKEIPPSPH